MTHKILKSNNQVLPRNTVRAWTPDEVARGALIKARQEYMEALEAALGLACAEDDFDESELTPTFEAYADQVEDGLEGTPDDELPPTPEALENYVGPRLLFPRGADDVMSRGKVVKHARDNSGNPMGRANGNPILDTREYIVEFEDGTEAELSANAIAQNMYAQYDPGGNCYVMFDSIVD